MHFIIPFSPENLSAGRRLSVGQSAAGCAVLFQDASFTWVAAEGGAVVSRSQGDAASQVTSCSFSFHI